MPSGPRDYLYDTMVHLPEGKQKRFGDLTRKETHEFMDLVDRGDPQAVYDASLLRLRAYVLSLGVPPPEGFGSAG